MSLAYQYIVDCVRKKSQFFFSRWGDGEFLAMHNTQGKNCDGVRYSLDLMNELNAIASIDQPYYMGLQELALNDYPELVSNYEQDWEDADVFYKASLNCKLNEIINAIRNRNPVVVHHSKKTADFLNASTFIKVDKSTAFNQRAFLFDEITRLGEDELVVLCCGPTANVLVDLLFKYSHVNSAIDFGSVFDPYIGIKSRQYHKDLVLEDI